MRQTDVATGKDHTLLPRLARGLAIAWLLMTLAMGTGLFFRHSWAAIRFPYALDYGEGPLLDQVIRLARLENIYKPDINTPPYTISNYPPLFVLLQVPFAWLFGPALWYGRVINLVSLTIAAACIGLTIEAMTHDRVAGVIAGLTLLTFPYIIEWSAFNRIDSLALGISSAGLATVVRWGHTRRGLICGAVLLTASVYTRQSYALAAPFAAFAWLLMGSSKGVHARHAFTLAAWVAGMGLAVFLLLTWITSGGFYFHIVTANVNPFLWETVLRYVKEMWRHLGLLLVAGALYLVTGLWLERKAGTSAWWTVAPYMVGATLSAITVGKSGSNVNYLFEFCAALSLIVGAWIAWPRKWPLLQALLILILLPQAAGITGWTREKLPNWILAKIAVMDEIEQMAELTREAEGPVLADEYMALVPLAGKSLAYQPFEFKQLYLAGLWDESALLQDIQAQKFPLLLILDSPWWDSQGERWTPQQLATISRSYQVTDRLADTLIYRPRAILQGE